MMIGMVNCGVRDLDILYDRHARTKSAGPVALIFVAVTLGAASNGSVVLNAAQGTAVVHMGTFGYPQTYRLPLSSAMGAYVSSSEQSDALRVSFNGGTALQLTPFNQMEGKGQAAFAINQFLREHGGTGSAY